MTRMGQKAITTVVARPAGEAEAFFLFVSFCVWRGVGEGGAKMGLYNLCDVGYHRWLGYATVVTCLPSGGHPGPGLVTCPEQALFPSVPHGPFSLEATVWWQAGAHRPDAPRGTA